VGQRESLRGVRWLLRSDPRYPQPANPQAGPLYRFDRELPPPDALDWRDAEMSVKSCVKQKRKNRLLLFFWNEQGVHFPSQSSA
jgi:hypothetical protein